MGVTIWQTNQTPQLNLNLNPKGDFKWQLLRFLICVHSCLLLLVVKKNLLKVKGAAWCEEVDEAIAIFVLDNLIKA